jgi:hypothetical protein
MINSYLSNIYHKSGVTPNIESLDFNYYDYELENFLIHLIRTAEFPADAETTEKNDQMIMNYYRLQGLIQYMYNIDYLMKKQKSLLEETFFTGPMLNDFGFCDSRMVDLQIDNKNHTCSLLLSSVLLYGERRIYKRIQVEGGTVLLIFKDAKTAEMKGGIAVECAEMNTVFNWHLMKTSENLFSLCVMCERGYTDHFILQITCSDIEAKVIEAMKPSDELVESYRKAYLKQIGRKGKADSNKS